MEIMFKSICAVLFFINVTSGCDLGLWGPTCSKSCPENCLDRYCDKQHGSCKVCELGWHGNNCNQPCPNCDRHFCRTETGVCEGECREGHWGERCEKSCTIGCQSCKRETGLCEKCKPWYWGQNCTNMCHQNCKLECDRYNGICTECKDRFWGPRCDRSCQYINCDSCDQYSGNCTKCKARIWGRECNVGCTPGCQYCHIDTGECRECQDGLWGMRCNRNCPEGCKDSKCQQENAYCYAGCKGGFTGVNCGKDCQTKCNGQTCVSPEAQCREHHACMFGCLKISGVYVCSSECHENCFVHDNTSDMCATCGFGRKGNNCEETCNINCKRNLQAEMVLCEKSTGRCLDGCVEGYFGDTCSGVCINTCRRGACNADTGACSDGCVPGFYGRTCRSRCSETCKDIISGSRVSDICEQDSGSCIHGCVDGWFGRQCKSRCHSNCINTTCHQSNGTCVYGCKNNGNCSPDAPEGTTEDEVPLWTMGNIATFVIASSVGLVLILTLILIALRRKSSSSRKRREERLNSNTDSKKRAENTYVKGSCSESVNPIYEDIDPDLIPDVFVPDKEFSSNPKCGQDYLEMQPIPNKEYMDMNGSPTKHKGSPLSAPASQPQQGAVYVLMSRGSNRTPHTSTSSNSSQRSGKGKGSWWNKSRKTKEKATAVFYDNDRCYANTYQ